jgi:ring-1,2-phenylacetyl-CoA epoxidase subunit PaaC
MDNNKLFDYLLQLGDNSMILGQCLGEWCGHGPILEVDMALTNIALDLFGQTRNYFQYAAEIEGKGRTEDDIAMLRDVREFRNCLLVEQPNGDFAQTIARQFFFDVFHHYFLEELKHSKDERLSAMAYKSAKEVSYHLRFSSEWMKRLGDGTQESHQRLQNAVNDLWMYVDELCKASPMDQEMADAGIGVNLDKIRPLFYNKVEEILAEATIQKPSLKWHQYGGKTGKHTEHLGFVLSELQWMQRTYPNMEW